MKILETRTIDGIKRRRYERADGTRFTLYEVGSDLVFLADLKALMRKAAAARANPINPAVHLIARDPDKVDAVLEALERGETQRSIAARLGVSTKTIQRVKWGSR